MEPPGRTEDQHAGLQRRRPQSGDLTTNVASITTAATTGIAAATIDNNVTLAMA